MKKYLFIISMTVMLSLVFIACGSTSDRELAQAIKEDMIKEKGTSLDQSYDMSVLVETAAIYGSSGGMELDQRIEKLKFLSSAKFRQQFIDWLLSNGYIEAAGERDQDEIRGTFTEKGIEYFKSTNSVIEKNTGYHFCFFDQEVKIIEKKKNDDGAYVVKYSIERTPVNAPHVTAVDLPAVDKNESERTTTVFMIKTDGKWQLKRFI